MQNRNLNNIPFWKLALRLGIVFILIVMFIQFFWEWIKTGNLGFFTDAFKNILLTWNAQDPVSAREVARNNAVYARQSNRNPYIDNNSYVTTIWGSAPLAVDSFELLASVSVYPNPSNDRKINIESGVTLDKIQLISINGQIIHDIQNTMVTNNTYTIENLPQGFYFLKLEANNSSITKKVIIN